MGKGQPKNTAQQTDKIALCKMFSGDYWEDENNLGYETINMFLPDKPEKTNADEPISYIYLPADGDYKVDEHKITKVLLVRGLPGEGEKTVQIIGKAEVVEELLEKAGKLRTETCTDGREFVGLLNLFEIFGERTELKDEDVSDKIDEIASRYNMASPQDDAERGQLGIKLGFYKKGGKTEKHLIGTIKTKYAKALKLKGVFDAQKETIGKTKYARLSYMQIFSKNRHFGKLNILASLKVKNLQLVKADKPLYLTTDSKKQGKDYIFVQNGKGLSARSQTVFLDFDESLWSNIEKANSWEDAKKLEIKKKDKYLQDSFLTVVKKENDELSYSNLFAYFFAKSPKFSHYFFKEIKCKLKSEEKGSLKFDLGENIDAQSVFIGEEDWMKAGGQKVEREERNIDIVLTSGRKVVVVENKIKSALNGTIKEDKEKKFKDQLPRYYNYTESKYNGCDKTYLIFAPDYNPIEKEAFGVVGNENMDEHWKIVRYSDIFDCCSDYKFLADRYFDKYDKWLFKEFLKAIKVHTDSSPNNYYRQMQKRLMRIKNGK